MKQWLVGLFCVLMAWTAFAEGPAAVSKRAEASMPVTGTIEVMPDGSVRSYAIDQADKLPPVVVQVIQQNVPGWKFQLDGKQDAAVKAKLLAPVTTASLPCREGMSLLAQALMLHALA